MDDDEDWTAEQAIAYLHPQAMALMDTAIQARQQGWTIQADQYLDEAVHWEALAAGWATDEPTRSILYRSAATLALEAGWPERARELAMRGLEGTPPEAIADELRGVLSRC